MRGLMHTSMRTGLIAAAACAAGLGACSKNPTTGRSQFLPLSRNDEVALGAQAAPQLTQEFGGEVQNPALQGYITEVGMRLKDQTEVDGPKRQWHYTLLDSDVINAFALPGERVFISKGLADKLTNEAQLAGVLGHETGHVMARHTAERQGQAMWVGVLSQGIGAVAGAAVKDPALGQALPALANGSGQLVVLRFSRQQESEADALGMRYMTKAGYNPEGQLQVMQVLKRESGGGGTPEWMATHPLPDTRIQDVQKLLSTEYASVQSQPDKYQFFPERYQQRYLSLARAAAPKKQKEPKIKAKQAAMTDEHGRERLLGAVMLDDPTTWCAVCRANALAGLPMDTH